MPILRSLALLLVTKFVEDLCPAFFVDQRRVEMLCAKLDNTFIFWEASLADSHARGGDGHSRHHNLVQMNDQWRQFASEALVSYKVVVYTISALEPKNYFSLSNQAW